MCVCCVWIFFLHSFSSHFSRQDKTDRKEEKYLCLARTQLLYKIMGCFGFWQNKKNEETAHIPFLLRICMKKMMMMIKFMPQTLFSHIHLRIFHSPSIHTLIIIIFHNFFLFKTRKQPRFFLKLNWKILNTSSSTLKCTVRLMYVLHTDKL